MNGLILFLYGVSPITFVQTVHEYKYLYDYIDESFKDVIEKEFIGDLELQIITEPHFITASVGQRIVLPCKVEKLPGEKTS